MSFGGGSSGGGQVQNTTVNPYAPALRQMYPRPYMQQMYANGTGNGQGTFGTGAFPAVGSMFHAATGQANMAAQQQAAYPWAASQHLPGNEGIMRTMISRVNGPAPLKLTYNIAVTMSKDASLSPDIYEPSSLASTLTLKCAATSKTSGCYEHSPLTSKLTLHHAATDICNAKISSSIKTDRALTTGLIHAMHVHDYDYIRRQYLFGSSFDIEHNLLAPVVEDSSSVDSNARLASDSARQHG